jgi:hypothetical protein
MHRQDTSELFYRWPDIGHRTALERQSRALEVKPSRKHKSRPMIADCKEAKLETVNGRAYCVRRSRLTIDESIFLPVDVPGSVTLETGCA